MQSTNHHFIPQMHLRRFSACPKETIVVHDKQWAKIYSGKQPRGQAYEKNLYSFIGESREINSHIEDRILSRIDDAASNAIDSILNECFLPNADDKNHKNILALYVASLLLRNPKHIESQLALGKKLGNEYLKQTIFSDPEFLDELKSLSTSAEFELTMNALNDGKITIKTKKQDAMIIQIELLDIVKQSLYDARWDLLTAQDDDEFILSDSPVFTCDPHSNAVSMVGTSRYGNETTLPLSSKACLLITGNHANSFSRRYASSGEVGEINIRSAYSADCKFFASRHERFWLDRAISSAQWDRSIIMESSHGFLMAMQKIDNANFAPLTS